MTELARAALIIAVTACVLVPLLGVVRGQPVREMLLDGLTLAFATIPEELPILVTVLVALGGLRMAQHGVLLRRLRAAETVGAITVLLADKTGTLTENRLVIERVEGDRARVLATGAAAHGTAAAQDPVDRALVQAAGHARGPSAPRPLSVRPGTPARERGVARPRRRLGGSQGSAGRRTRSVRHLRARAQLGAHTRHASRRRWTAADRRRRATPRRRSPATAPPAPRPSSTSSVWSASAIRCAPASGTRWPSSPTPACGRSSSAATIPRRSARPRARPGSALPSSCTAAGRWMPSTMTNSPGTCAARP